MVHINYPIDYVENMRLLKNTHAFQNFHNVTIVIQQIRMSLWYDVRIHTYIHTYIQTPLAFNTLMRGSLRLAPIILNFEGTAQCETVDLHDAVQQQ